jgi:GYF domain 2
MRSYGRRLTGPRVGGTNIMASRSWFFATDGQQHGPYPEDQFRDLIGRGDVRPDTYVWSEGMAAWQFASDVPGLLSGGARPPAFPGSGRPGAAVVQAGGPLAVDLSIWQLLGRVLLYTIGFLLVVPAPWVATGFYRWFVAHLRVPQRPNVAFTGQPGDIWYVFVLLALCSYAGLGNVPYLQYVLFPIEAFLSWMVVRWLVANVSPDGNARPLAFTGSPWAYVGWYLLGFISFITIIGWAWVLTAWMRWMCRHIDGTRREVTFNASGLEMLWRTIVFGLGCGLVIPIPWVLGWYFRWNVSQVALVERTA